MKALPLLFLLVACATRVAEAVELQLWPWPDSAPGKRVPNSRTTDDLIRAKVGEGTITDIHEPTITFYRPEKPNGTSVIVVPSGDYGVLSGLREAGQVCDWLNGLGVTGILLKYRVPTRDESVPHEKPLQDAAKAIALVRKNAKAWDLDPGRVGLLGFGTGGHLVARIACDRPAKKAVPNFAINIGGGGFVELWEPTKLQKGFRVPADAPPMFMTCVDDEGQTSIALTALYLACLKHKVPAELHLVTSNGQGFLRHDNKQSIHDWPRRCAEWMTSMGWLPNVAALDDEIQKMEARVNTILKLSKATTLGVECGFELDRVRQYKAQISEARKKGDPASQALVLVLEKQVQELEKGIEEAMKPRPLIVESLVTDIQMLKQKLADMRMRRDQLLDWKETPIPNPEARIAELDVRLISLTEKLRPVCQDDVPILQRKMVQVTKDIEQARKGENKSAIARLEVLRDEISKAQAGVTSRGDGWKIEDVAAQIIQVNAELTQLKAQRDDGGGMGGFMRAEVLKKEIKKREQGVENIARVMRTHFFCGNDLIDAEASLQEARKKLAAADQTGDKEAVKSAKETIQKVTSMLAELEKPVVKGVNVETISEDINRLKKEKLELEAELEFLEAPPKPTQP